MRCVDAALVLQKLSGSGGDVELSQLEMDVLHQLVAEGLVAPADEQTAERERLNELRRALAAVRAQAPGDPREAQLRTLILELSEKLARSQGGVRVRESFGGGPYRGGATSDARAYQLTYMGRTLLSDLAPRLTRVGGEELAGFGREVAALRETFDARAAKASQILRFMPDIFPTAADLAKRSAAVGLAARPEEPRQLAEAFAEAMRYVEHYDNVDGSGDEFSWELEMSAAESLCLGAPALPDVTGRLAEPFHRLRLGLLQQYCGGRADDAQDAAVLLLAYGSEARNDAIARAMELAKKLQAESQTPITLALALLLVASGNAEDPYIAGRVSALYREITQASNNPMDALSAAVLLALAGGGLDVLLDRWQTGRAYLVRFGSEEMTVPAAMLALLATETAETLDNLRLAAAAVQKHRLALGGMETMANGMKLMLQSAILASGSEGDPEERLGVGPRAVERLPALGLAALAATVPLARVAVTAFHRPALSAAAYEYSYHPAHSSYVWGGGRSYGRSSSWG